MNFTWLWIALVSLALFKILDEVTDDGWEGINFYSRRCLITLFFLGYGVWFCQNFH